MSITSDVKTYTDAAIEQAKQVVDQAQSRLTKSAGDASKYVDLDVVKDRVGGYVAQAKATTSAVADKAEGLVSDLRHRDPRLEKAFDDAEAAATTIVGTVNEKVVAPARTLIGRGTHAAAPVIRIPKTANGTASATTARAKQGTASQPPAQKATAQKATAQKATAQKATAKKATAKKATAKKAPAKKVTVVTPAPSANGTSGRSAE